MAGTCSPGSRTFRGVGRDADDVLLDPQHEHGRVLDQMRDVGLKGSVAARTGGSFLTPKGAGGGDQS